MAEGKCVKFRPWCGVNENYCIDCVVEGRHEPEFVKVLREHGFRVVRSHIAEGQGDPFNEEAVDGLRSRVQELEAWQREAMTNLREWLYYNETGDIPDLTLEEAMRQAARNLLGANRRLNCKGCGGEMTDLGPCYFEPLVCLQCDPLDEDEAERLRERARVFGACAMTGFICTDGPSHLDLLAAQKRRRTPPDKSGRKWEKEFEKALQGLQEDCFFTDSNVPKAINDWRFTYRGHSFLGELKKTDANELQMSACSRAQKDFLNDHRAAGGTSFVAIKRALPNYRARVWCLRWDDWLALPRRTLNLDDPPPEMVELHEFERPHSLGSVWGLQPFIDACFARYLKELENSK